MISICIITRNQEKNIKKCLESIKDSGFGGEIVVVDTGSEDATRDIALQFTDRVFDFPWCDDFGAAKNYAISKASKDFVMLLDSDEYLHPLDYRKLESLVVTRPDMVGRIRRINTFERKGIRQTGREWINRIFSRKRFRYEGAIHEQVVSMAGHSYDTYEAPVVIDHSGYDLTEEELRKKAQRNILLLKKELLRLEAQEAESKEQIPYILYQLGKSYYMNGEYQEASEYFSKGLEYDLDPGLEYVIDMVETYGYALINSGKHQEAMMFENIYEEFGNSADFKFLMGLIYMNNALFGEAIREFKEAAKYRESKMDGTNSYSAYYNIGVIYECMKDIEEALKYYRKCGDYPPAVDRIKDIEKI